jgi:hypothetical protein
MGQLLQAGALTNFWSSFLPLLSVTLQEPYTPQIVSSMQAAIPEVRTAGKVFHLNKPISVSVTVENGYYQCESKPLGILSFGQTHQEAIRSFLEDFSMLWDVIAQSPDNGLTPDAIELKRRLLALVNVVIPE